MTFGLFMTRAALYSTLMGILLFDDKITAEKAFVFSTFFHLISNAMTFLFVRGFAEIKECLVAVERLQKFLTFEEFQTGNATLNATANYYSINSNSEIMLNENLKTSINIE